MTSTLQLSSDTLEEGIRPRHSLTRDSYIRVLSAKENIFMRLGDLNFKSKSNLI
jgi:hypothetical protein